MAQSPGAVKRQKELARLEYQAQKKAKKEQRAVEKKQREEKGIVESDVIPMEREG